MSIVADRNYIYDVDFKETEIWVHKKPSMGDHIRVMRLGGVYSHHGVYVSDDEIIHFTGDEDDSILDWSKPEVIQSDLDYFLKGGVLEVKEYTDEEFEDLYSPEQIVSYARACIGDKGYHLICNNCEHFANMCTLGRFRSVQVENVLGLGDKKIPTRKDKNMGFFSKVGNAIKSLFGGGSKSSGGSRSTTTYEPDKVKIAEIEADARIRVANIENEKANIEADAKLRAARLDNDRIELMKQAKIDLLQFETEMNIALEQAKARGFNSMAQTIIEMQYRMNEIAEKRIEIIEKGSMGIVKEIETFYAELGDKIEADNEEYSKKKLPELLEILEKYEPGSAAYNLYRKRIDTDMNLQAKHYSMQLENIARRQDIILSGFISSRDKIIEQTGQLTSDMFKNLQERAMLDSPTYEKQNESLKLDTTKVNNQYLLEDK